MALCDPNNGSSKEMQFFKTHGQLKCISASKAFQRYFTAFGFAAQPVTLLQLGKLKTVSSLYRGKGGHQFERFSTHPSLKDNALGILRGVFEILISSFMAGLSESRQEWLRQCTLERPEMHG